MKANFRLWFESGWRHALVGAEMGKVLLTVHVLLRLEFSKVEAFSMASMLVSLAGRFSRAEI